MAAFLTDRAWREYRGTDFPVASWVFEREVLQALGDARAVSLISRERFVDFDMSLEWRLPIGGNSGILYRVNEEAEAPWQSGAEMQLLDNSGHPDGRVPETSCGALYGLYAPQDAPLCAAGLYNIARVSVRGTRVEHWLNGTRVLACDMASEDFRARVARSKFSRFSAFADAGQGHIVLQHHGTDAWFRNVRIEAAR